MHLGRGGCYDPQIFLPRGKPLTVAHILVGFLSGGTRIIFSVCQGTYTATTTTLIRMLLYSARLRNSNLHESICNARLCQRYCGKLSWSPSTFGSDSEFSPLNLVSVTINPALYFTFLNSSSMGSNQEHFWIQTWLLCTRLPGYIASFAHSMKTTSLCF